mmetsp:Transcript_1637/g.1946  ORF Transcript_1637/g.1946 Transcript_1637/m.1946 type:complete len:94 (+) Transcript_1637:188-469(+)
MSITGETVVELFTLEHSVREKSKVSSKTMQFSLLDMAFGADGVLALLLPRTLFVQGLPVGRFNCQLSFWVKSCPFFGLLRNFFKFIIAIQIRN